MVNEQWRESAAHNLAACTWLGALLRSQTKASWMGVKSESGEPSYHKYRLR